MFNRLLKKSLFVVRRAHHERKVSVLSMPLWFALSLSKPVLSQPKGVNEKFFSNLLKKTVLLSTMKHT